MKHAITFGFALFFLASLGATIANAGKPATVSGPFAPIDAKLLDGKAFAQWVGGSEKPFERGNEKEAPQPTAIVWTTTTMVRFSGLKFGDGRAVGQRHLRVGFNQPVPIGSVLVRGGGALSVLKPDAAYPGDLAKDSEWIPAERLSADGVTRDEVGIEGLVLWTLPAGTETRALRFTHTPSPGDREMAGYLGGVWISHERVGNVAPQAMVQTAMRDDASAKLVDQSNNGTWGAWDNGEKGAAVAISPEHSELITLTWSQPVELAGVCLIWAGFSSVEFDAFTGRESEIIREAPQSSWQRVASQAEIDGLYPLGLGPHWIAFDKPITTRALRLRITGPPKLDHPHLTDKGFDGRRVWLGEVMALAPLAKDRSLTSLILPKAQIEPPPIPIRVQLPEAGVVTLVIEDKDHQRIRNLISETPLPAGENVVWWDGSDDLLRDPQAASHGVYHIPARPVAPGTYQVRGLWHKPLSLHYEFSIYNAGKPAWETADGTGCWMTTHTPPTAVAVVPGDRTADGQPLVMIGAYVAEGGHGLQWLHEDGTKLGGQHWIGGTWTGAPTITVDLGPKAVADHLCYVASAFEGELRVTAKNKALADVPVLKEKLGEEHHPQKKESPPAPQRLDFDGGDRIFCLASSAAYDGKVVLSMIRQNELTVIDVNEKKIVARIPIDNPRGLAFDSQGRLLALSGKQLVRFANLSSKPETLITAGLEDPHQIALDGDGNILISDRGNSHQIKKFSAAGKPLGTIGLAGAPAAGPYNPLHMNNPNGLAVDTQGRVWVAESDNLPRRVSLWSADGKLVRAFYGPSEYGGGGALDPKDRTRFYYRGMQFKLDWDKGTDELVQVFYRPDGNQPEKHGAFWPDWPLYPPQQSGRQYFASCYTHWPTNGDQAAFVWRLDDGIAHLVAAMGDLRSLPALADEKFASKLPAGTNLTAVYPRPEENATFAWSDANGDGLPQPDEVTFIKRQSGGVTVMNDLSFVVARFGEEGARFIPKFDANGTPSYDLEHPDNLGPAAGRPPSSGGDQSLTEPGGWTIDTIACPPYSPYGLGGKFKGQPRWSYPSPWPGLHPSHEAAVPDHPGEVIGHTRLLGGWVQGKAGPMFCINGNMGNMYLFTADGLFVSTLFHDSRTRPFWNAPVPIRNMDLTEISLHDENFWPSITQVADGQIYLVDGARTSLVRVDGLETIRRLEPTTVTVTEADLAKARDWFAKVETDRHAKQGSGTLQVPLLAEPRKVDGNLDDWPATTDWASIDRRGTRANFNSNSRPYEVSAAVAVTGTDLFAAWRTTEKDLLNNSGETPLAPFKHGGCLDIMLATDPSAKPDRSAPVAGDERLLVTRVKNETRALLYRAKVPGSKEPVGFSSPWRTVNFDSVEDVSSQVTLADDKEGHFEISIPLSALGWKPKVGQTYRADLGVLRGTGGQTTQRVYWSNKATAITADVPSEAELAPKLWGKWTIFKP